MGKKTELSKKKLLWSYISISSAFFHLLYFKLLQVGPNNDWSST